MNFKNKKIKNLLIFLLLAISVWILQNIILRSHLEYGFRDGDWFDIRRFLTFGDLTLDDFIANLKVNAAYTYQLYYPGLLTKLYGLNFGNLNQATHLFKFLATLAIFPMVLVVTKNKMTAFITTLIYSVAYPTIGPLFSLVTGGYFVTIIFLSFFLIIYWNLINQTSLNFKLIIGTQVLFILTLILGPERMYPLIPLIIIVEFLLILKKPASQTIKTSLIRLFSLLLPLVVFYLIYSIWFKDQINPSYFAPQFLIAIKIRYESILAGNWQLILYPFASFGSLFLYGDHLNFLGSFNTTSFSSFLSHFLFRQMLIFSIITIFLMRLISKKPYKLILITLLPTFIFGLIIFLMSKNWQGINSGARIHFDTNFVGIPAIFGFYLSALNLSFFFAWLRGNDEKKLIFPIFLGSAVSFLFIFFTWIGSDVQLLFTGPQRYLTTPAIGSSLSLAGLIVLIFNQLKKVRVTKYLAWLSILIVVQIILINADITKKFFDYELNYAGMRGSDQTRIKNKFWSIAPNISNNEISLFYFDESQDIENGYFDETAIMAGFEDWIQFDHGRLIVVNRPFPGMLRTNIQCPEHTQQSCFEILKKGLIRQNGEWGILYKDPIRQPLGNRFFKLNNFYAMRFINRDLVDIRKEILDQLGITE